MKRKILTIFIIISSLQLLAQNSIRGIVIDAETGEGLIGATVKVKGTSKGKITDLHGNFAIGGISESTVTLEVNYVGYDAREIQLTLSNKITNATIRLQQSTTSLDEVVVEGVLEGQIAAMVTMKKAANIKNVVSAEQIVTFPDLNAAEVMQRIPGITLQRDQGEGRFVQLRGTPPELTNFNINGEQIPSPEGNFRYIGMDVIPSDQIEFIEVTKVMTPDMDADGIGGSVNVITKEAKEGPPQIRTVLASGYNNLRQTPNFNFQFSYGQRFKKFGFQVNTSFFENNQGSDNIEYKFTKGPFFNSGSQQQGRDNFFLHFREVQLRHYDIQRTRIAVSPTLDYRFSDRSKVYLKAMYNSFRDEETRRRKIFDLEDPFDFDRYLFGGIEHDTRSRTDNQTLSTLSIGGEHTLGRIKLDYQLFVSAAGETTPDYFEARFENPGQAIEIEFDFTDPDYPRAVFDSEEATDYENYDYDELQLESTEVKEVLITPRMNIEVPYTLNNGQDGFVKFGGKIRSRKKERDVFNSTFGNYRPINNGNIAGEGEQLVLTNISGGWSESNLLNQGYLLDFMPDPELFQNHYEFNSAYYVPSRNESRSNTFNQDYEYEEDIYAAYGMVRHNLDRLMILGGIRYERTDVTKNLGYRVRLDGSQFLGLDTLLRTKTQDFLLPQLQLKYELNKNINIRGSITKTYSRPNYRDVIAAREDDRNESTVGNPDLDFPTSTNVDFMIERYFKKSIFSAGIFYKKIDDFIYRYRRFTREGPPGSGDFPTFELTIPLNGKEADVYGTEFQAQFKFGFLPGILSDFGIYSNYTYTYSRAFVPERVAANYSEAIIIDLSAENLTDFFTDINQEEVSLPGQAEHTANLALFYDGPKFFARLSANYQDDFLVELGADPDLDEYYDQSFRLDYTMNYKLNDNVTIFGDWINITNTPLRFYLGSDEVVKQQEFYSWWFRTGARINL